MKRQAAIPLLFILASVGCGTTSLDRYESAMIAYTTVNHAAADLYVKEMISIDSLREYRGLSKVVRSDLDRWRDSLSEDGSTSDLLIEDVVLNGIQILRDWVASKRSL